ncbi:MAG TPA: outer membrane lipoprotein-sorting protein [Fimbriimonadaceae bacterium]|nr:outer membrane lipoprotein-sorting protein [Fimbriimonadaceae bacterium]
MCLAIFAASIALTQTPSIQDVLQTNLKSATFKAVVGSSNMAELQKINKDFAQSYRFKSMDVWLKEPFMIRMESKVDDSEILMVINGPIRKLSIPKARLSQKLNLQNSPGKRQTAFDFGLMPPDLFDGFFKADFVRTDRRTGEYVFDVTYGPGLDKDKSRHRIWVDPQKKMITKRQWFANRGGFLMATFEYTNPVEVAGVWMPTTITVSNADNKLAGTTNYKDIQVNPILADSLFSVG